MVRIKHQHSYALSMFLSSALLLSPRVSSMKSIFQSLNRIYLFLSLGLQMGTSFCARRYSNTCGWLVLAIVRVKTQQVWSMYMMITPLNCSLFERMLFSLCITMVSYSSCIQGEHHHSYRLYLVLSRQNGNGYTVPDWKRINTFVWF